MNHSQVDEGNTKFTRRVTIGGFQKKLFLQKGGYGLFYFIRRPCWLRKICRDYDLAVLIHKVI